jgi:hypothetical protein
MQLVPGWGKPVAGIVCEGDVVTQVYAKENPLLTTHPHPSSSKYFIVSQRPAGGTLCSIYLVDVFQQCHAHSRAGWIGAV